MNNMKTGADGLAVLHYFEKCRLNAYPDPGTGGDPWTIGWGDTGPDVVCGLCIDQTEADARLERRLATEFEPAVNAAVKVGLSSRQFDALVCLTYNIGVHAFPSSTLLWRLNLGQYTGAAAQFEVWNRSGGIVMLGLRRRRAAEAAMFGGAGARQAIAIGAAVK